MSVAITHAELMDRTYRYQRLIYDLTRRYYLLGRDRLIDYLAPKPGARVLEVGCGTGRNLLAISRRYPEAILCGLDISSEMLRSAEAKLGRRAGLVRADACDFDGKALFGVDGFDRIVLSFSLSMIPDWTRALRNAAAHLRPGGELHVVDFGDQAGLPRWFNRLLTGWLRRFHVTPRHELEAVMRQIAREEGFDVRFRPLYLGYSQYGVLTRR